jgi:hypothetical protein
MVRPGGWHRTESIFSWMASGSAAAFFDFGLYFFHNA